MSERRERFVEAVSARQYEYESTERARLLGEIVRRKRVSDRNRRLAAGAGVATVLLAVATLATLGGRASTPDGPGTTGLLADGSRVSASPDARWVVHEVTATRVRLEVPVGRVRFEVSRRPERDFVVTAAGVVVTVVGTVFSVDVRPDEVRVDVEEGRVRVRRADGTETLLVGGEALTLSRSSAGTPGTAAASPEASAPSLPPVVKPAPRPSTTPATSPQAGASPLLAVPPVPTQPSPTFAARVAEGDALLARGDARGAVQVWAAAVDGFPDEPGRAVVAFRRARVMLQSLRDAAGAAKAFAAVEALGAAPPLVEDALAREVEAWVDAKDLEQARLRAAAFVARYPGSYRRAAVERAAGLTP
ncbi:MAG: FecR domain-containing protein [Myxococcaceae bacterium]|jgi:transmembrane sensor|nr:FecR domain-containing protein [Myxococcaceae bacterium]